MFTRIYFPAFVISLFFVTASFSQPDAELEKYIKANYLKREVNIPMRDGVKLFTIIYEPKDRTTAYPMLLNRTPYSIGPYGSDSFPQSLGPSVLYARAGFIFVNQDRSEERRVGKECRSRWSP